MPRESKANRTKRALEIHKRLKKLFPDAKCSLDYRSPLELLVATMLSAQCSDVQVNKVTPALFKRYTTPAKYAAATQAAMEKAIRAIGLFRNKAKNIRGAMRMIVDEFDSRVPDTMEDLIRLPGVARKTANVILGNAFGKNEGVVVDTHVSRLAGRLKLSKWPKPRADKIEQDLMALIPRDDWALFSHLLVYHGRGHCTARKPNCEDCPLTDLCPSAGKV